MTRETDRARRHTARAVLERIDAETRGSLLRHVRGDGGAGAARIRALDREWDVDCAIETEAALTGLAGLALGILAHRRLCAVPGFVASTLLLSGATGLYPLPVFRRLGVRTAREVQGEPYALEAVRGDFEGLAEMRHAEPRERVRAVLRAIDA